ncbi:sulfatase-like hydrolase/transferase [Salegentibacter flavus]|uniref:sulfatase-like hydrolase/transferase n=1 Tax=Salegentibacter flavus TaxID=287099 RepID=UPI001587EB6E|nr:sulfatase-like hydrolase/transferase [Salegentibacter flavus]
MLILIAVFIQASYYNLFADRLSASTIFILIETNTTETIEFLGAYLNFFSFILLVCLLTPLILIKFINKPFNIYLPEKALSIVLLLILLFVYQYKSLANHNLYNIAFNSYQDYLEETELYDEFGLDDPIGEIPEVIVKTREERKVFVMLIGESTTRHRMSLYGYERQTNPKLEKIKEELLVYRNVISPHTHTIPSLSKLMSFKHYEEEGRLDEGTIIQLMNKAGLETHWISNQKPIGLHETLITKMANASHNLHFLNVKNYNIESIHDEVVLEPLKKVLQENEDQFIVIHLLGTHAGYANRYPPSFEFFTDIPPILNDSAGVNVVNSYDNAIRYNDFIVSEIISEVKEQDAYSYVLYFSDHGEDVYQVHDGASHTETKGTYPMYDVPFILWQSDSFRENFNINFEPDRPYMLDDLIFSISDLSGLKFKGFQFKRSIFNENFKERDRIIYNKKNYDSIFSR